MASIQKDLGHKTANLNALVENLQRAMGEASVPFFAAQNRLLAKLARMDRDTLKHR